MEQRVHLALAGAILRDRDQAILNGVIGTVEVSGMVDTICGMIGARLVGSDLYGERVEVVAVFLIRRMRQQHVDRVRCVHKELGELIGGVALGKDDDVEPIGDGAISQDGLD